MPLAWTVPLVLPKGWKWEVRFGKDNIEMDLQEMDGGGGHGLDWCGSG